jgi:hypothetical protein
MEVDGEPGVGGGVSSMTMTSLVLPSLPTSLISEYVTDSGVCCGRRRLRATLPGVAVLCVVVVSADIVDR